MLLKTHRNGGDASLQDVAKAWKLEPHHFHWSEYEHDHWAVDLGHKLEDRMHQTPAIPDPRNVHH